MRTMRQSLSRDQSSHKLTARKVSLSNRKQLSYTIKRIGDGIKAGSHHLPIIKHAQILASKAGPKDYIGQIGQLYDDFVKRWRYVRDPLTMELVHVSGPSIYGQIMGFDRSMGERGAGDCDDATVAMGSMLESIGLPIRIVTTAPLHGPGTQSLFNHVFVQTHVPKVGWYTVDPVGFPDHGPGWTPPHSRIGFWNKEGRLVEKQGDFPHGIPLLGDDGGNMYPNQAYQDYGFGSLLGADTGQEPEDWSTHGLAGFGAYANQYGIIGESPIMMEFDGDDEFIHPDYKGVGAVVRTKMLEMDPKEYMYARQTGSPRIGAVALGDDGDVYQYTTDPVSGLGFFKKLFRKARKKIRKVAKFVGSKAKKLIKKLPGGKYLVKLHNKIHKVAMKIARPLTKFVGKYAKKLAPIAALIPGYGPVIAAGLHTAGRIANVMKKFGVTQDSKGKPKFKSGQQAAAFKNALTHEAEKMKRTRRKHGGRLIKAGTREHRAFMRGLGVDVPEYPEYN